MWQMDVDPLMSVYDVKMECKSQLAMNKLSLPFSLHCAGESLLQDEQCISFYNMKESSQLELTIELSEKPIKIGVKVPRDVTLICEVNRLMTFSHLKSMIEEQTGIKPEAQLLQCNNIPLLNSDTILESHIYNNDCLTLDYDTEHIITDYTEGMKRRQFSVKSTARLSTKSHMKNLIMKKWGYDPEEQFLTAELDDGLGTKEQKCDRLCVIHTETINVHITLPDGSMQHMKVNPRKTIGDIKRDVIKQASSLHSQCDIFMGDCQKLSDEGLAAHYLTQTTNLHVKPRLARQGKKLT